MRALNQHHRWRREVAVHILRHALWASRLCPLHKNNVCIHCQNFRSTGVTITEGPAFSAREIKKLMRL